MKFYSHSLSNLTLVSAAVYILILAITAKGISFYGSQHPQKEELLIVHGIVRQVRLGGEGKSTWFKIEKDSRINRYSSYYGKVWSGMKHIQEGDRIIVLAERNKLSRDELIRGKSYYIWELIHGNDVIVAYKDVHEMVQSKEETLNRYIDGFLAISAVFVIIAYIRQLYSGKEPGK